MQSNKDSSGGKSHGSKKTGSSGKPNATVEKKASAQSPVGSQKHGEKKTTPSS